jgi:outer membrane receptor protein involved in Fe transport
MKTSRLETSIARYCLALVVVVLFACGASAQSTTDGAIGGLVTDQSGAAVPNAKVTVKNTGTNAEESAITDDTGYFRVGKLQPATYMVTVDAQGFAPFKAEKVIVQVGTVTDISAHLNVASAGSTVVVSAEVPQVNTDSPEFAPILDQAAIENLPINGGRWSNFALLTPGVVNDLNGFGLVSFRGISTLLNNNTIDGADNNEAFFSEERGRTRAGYSSAKVAIQEFQVNTSNYSSEYGRSAGGVVNTVTKSGTNEIHGEAYFYDRDNGWGSRNPFTNLTSQTSPGVFTSTPFKPKDWRKMWGFGIGGPIIKDKLFFFLAYDQYQRNFPGTAVPGANNPTSSSFFFAAPSAATISTLASRLGVTPAQATTDYDNGLTALAGILGPVPRTGDQLIFFPKIDWEINRKNHASFSVNRMRWSSPAGIQTQQTNTFAIASFGNDYVKDTWGVAKLNTLFTNTISNEARYQYGRDFEFENNQTPTPYEQSTFLSTPGGYINPLGLPPQVAIAGSNGFTLGTPSFLLRPRYPDERRQQFADTVSWSRSRHTLKFGVDFSHVNDLAENLRNQFGSYSYSSLLNYFSDFYKPSSCAGLPCYSSYSQAFGPLAFQFNTDDIAFFAEDSWKILPHFTLNLGLRYEYEKMPGVFSNLVNSVVPQTGSLPSDKNNFGPRVGFAWDIFGDGKTALRGGYGVYYGRIINSTIYSALTTTGIVGSQLSYTLNASQGPTFPTIISGPTGSIKPAAVFFGSNYQNPEIQQMDLTLERQLGWDTVLSVSYLGSLGRDLPNFVDTNLAAPTKTVTYTVSDTTGKGPLANGSTVTVPLFTARTNSNFGALTDIFGVSSNYNALAVQLSHRLNHHVQFSANYTFSHALDYGVNESTFNDTNDLFLPNDIKSEYGNSSFDVKHRFTLSSILDSPWHVDGWAGNLANGWELAPIWQAQTGLPYSLTTSGSPANGLGAVSSGVNGSGGAFRLPQTGRNDFRYPRTSVIDMRLSKRFAFTERYSLQLIGEAFNLFNRQNVTSVNNLGYFLGGTAAAPTLSFNSAFGSVANSNSNFAYSTRQVQIGARLFF